MILDHGLNKKATAFLARLRGEVSVPEASGKQGPQETEIARLTEMERRLEALAQRLESPPAPPHTQAQPHPPTEIMLYLQTRTELLEQKLRTTQEDALRSGILLREREEAQRQARTEMDELFRSIRERNRAEIWDAQLRQEFLVAQDKIDELQTQLRTMERISIPAREVLRLWETEEGRSELERRLRASVEAAGAPSSSAAPAPPVAMPAMTERPTPEVLAEGLVPPQPTPPKADAALSAEGAVESPRALAILMGRLADLERRLHETEAERDTEKARRLTWEKNMLTGLLREPDRWHGRPGAEVVVEAAMESLMSALKERDTLAGEISGLVGRIQQEPLDSPELRRLRGSLNEAERKMDEIQTALQRHMSVVQAWLKQG